MLQLIRQDNLLTAHTNYPTSLSPQYQRYTYNVRQNSTGTLKNGLHNTTQPFWSVDNHKRPLELSDHSQNISIVRGTIPSHEELVKFLHFCGGMVRSEESLWSGMGWRQHMHRTWLVDGEQVKVGGGGCEGWSRTPRKPGHWRHRYRGAGLWEGETRITWGPSRSIYYVVISYTKQTRAHMYTCVQGRQQKTLRCLEWDLNHNYWASVLPIETAGPAALHTTGDAMHNTHPSVDRYVPKVCSYFMQTYACSNPSMRESHLMA